MEVDIKDDGCTKEKPGEGANADKERESLEPNYTKQQGSSISTEQKSKLYKKDANGFYSPPLLRSSPVKPTNSGKLHGSSTSLSKPEKNIGTAVAETNSSLDETSLNGSVHYEPGFRLDSTYTVEDKLKNNKSGAENLNRSECELAECESISDYVENAILNSSNTNLFSASPGKSGASLDSVGLSHLPPRLTSFESSSTLNHEGLLHGVACTPDAGLKLNYASVSLDFVRSAAAAGRLRHKGENSTRENTSRTSSFISSVDSDDGSTVGSDIVENLYNNVRETSSRRNPSSSTVLQSLDVSTGDIEKDLFPLLFPGRRCGGKKNEDKLSTSLSHFDYTQPPNSQSTSTSKVDDFLQRNFNNNNCLSADNKQKNIAEGKTEKDILFRTGLSTTDPGVDNSNCNNYRKCKNCFGIIFDTKASTSEEMDKAIDFFGQCLCASANVPSNPVIEIDFCNSSLKEVPEEIGDHAETLTKLLLESNNISELPKELFICQNLRYLSVSDNDIATLPPSLASLINLIHLDVSKNVIEDVPECIRCCKTLQVLDASVNPIEKLSEGFTQLINLRELYMNDCFFDFLPANFGRMSQLCVLELRDNQLQILPRSIRRLTQLTRLDLGGNVFQEWSDVISKLTELEELWMDGNELPKIPPDIGNLTNLRYLDLSKNLLESIPSQIGSLEQLTDLILSENNLTALPDTIGFLRQLTIFNLELNQISALPDSIGKLHALAELDISHNKLESLPSSIGKLKNLTTLLLDDNNLGSIPQELGMCLKLKILQLSRNHIEILPDSIGDLSNLRVLNICQNRIPYLPFSVRKLAGLDALWISMNQSKANVPLSTKLENGRKVLTNVLLPQNGEGLSRVRQVLGSVDDNDEESYANDAADDDDLEAYAQRERGKTHVVFDLDAITYSNDVQVEMYQSDDEDALFNDQTYDRLSDGETNGVKSSKRSFADSTESEGFSSTEKSSDEVTMDQHMAMVSATQESSNLSVWSDSAKINTISVKSDETPMIETVRVVSRRQNDVDDVKNSSENGFPGELLQLKQGSTSQKPSKKTDIDYEGQEKLDNFLPVGGRGMRSWSPHSDLPTSLTEKDDDSSPSEDVPVETAHNNSNLTSGSTDSPNLSISLNSFSKQSLPPTTSPHNFQRNHEAKALSTERAENHQSFIPQSPEMLNVSNASSITNNSFNNASVLLDRLEQLTKRNRDVTSKKQQEHVPEIFSKTVHDKPGSSTASENKNIPESVQKSCTKEVPPIHDEQVASIIHDTGPNSTSVDENENTNKTDKISFKKKLPSDGLEIRVIETDSKLKTRNIVLRRHQSNEFEFCENEAKSEATKDISGGVTNTDKLTENDTEDVIEDKPSSVSSGESIPVTDLDSGVGYDIESQESIPDVAEEQNDVEIAPASIVSFLSPTKNVHDTKSSSIRRGKGGWLALVGTEKSENKIEEENLTQKHRSLNISASLTKSTDKPVSSQIDLKNSWMTRSLYAPSVTVDSTTVTYSHDYHVARVQNERSLSATSRSNKVADNIKKFEKFFDKAMAMPLNPDENKQNTPSRYSKSYAASRVSQSPTVVSFTKSPNTPVSTVFTSNRTAKSKLVYRSPASSNDFNPNPSRDDAAKVSKSSSRILINSTQPMVDQSAFADSRDVTCKSGPNEADAFPARRVSSHTRKSKFEEALAATKHKHFRDKAEKMMQQQSSSASTNRRLSRHSSSSISSIPRITSPVPHHHHSPVDHGTPNNANTESRGNQAPRVLKENPARSKWKETLKPAETFSQCTSSTSNSKVSEAGLSRERPVSSRQTGKMGFAPRSSVKKIKAASADGRKSDIDKTPKISLEEQLGQLLLDGSANVPVNDDKGFVPYVGKDSKYLSPPSNLSQASFFSETKKISQSHSSHSLNSSTNPTLDDWKVQLLQHIERKKQEKEGSTSKQTLIRPSVDKFNKESYKRSTSSLRHLGNSTSQSSLSSLGGNRVNKRVEVPQENISPRSISSSETVSKAQDRRKHYSFSKDEPQRNNNHFTRSSARFSRNRTPGPEVAASESKKPEVATRPKSAMDMPTSSTTTLDHQPYLRRSDWNVRKEETFSPLDAPPSYEDHVIRRATSAAVTQDHRDYVNIEYIDHVRSSMRVKQRKKSPAVTTYNELDKADPYPLRSTGSHESILNSKTEKQRAYESDPIPSGVRGSNSHNSILDNTYQPIQNSRPSYHMTPVQDIAPYAYHHINPRHGATFQTQPYAHHKRLSDETSHLTKDHPKSPAMISQASRARTMPAREEVNTYYHQEQNRFRDIPEQRPHPTRPSKFNDEYAESRHVSSLNSQRVFGEREDESVASAFRPYQQQNNQPLRNLPKPTHDQYPSNLSRPVYGNQSFHPQQNIVDCHRKHRPSDRDYSSYHAENYPQQNRNYPYTENRYRPTYDEENNTENDPSLSGELSHYRSTVDASVELITVTVRKNPTFGFHIMGGIDAGGNPYRPDDDGVFVTYVAPGGAADGLVQPGDKILLVNGSDFVGIVHKRAVDLLRNAGQVAVLVMERLAGRPV